MAADAGLDGSADEVTVPQLHRPTQGGSGALAGGPVEAQLHAIPQLEPLRLLGLDRQRQRQFARVRSGVAESPKSKSTRRNDPMSYRLRRVVSTALWLMTSPGFSVMAFCTSPAFVVSAPVTFTSLTT